MKVQINTDNTIKGKIAMADHFRDTVERALSRISDHITRVEVHLSEENSRKGNNNEKCCMMEARLEGRQPIAVSQQAATMAQAVDGAADKMRKLVESILERLQDQKFHRTEPVAPQPEFSEEL